ncbi:peptidase, M16 family [Clostridiales bacterium oral taxon 876 str. F0540]|nr:peptidase, M16 family [Clostridiales bacterium oral taxon 876 str. F0540]
MYNKVILSNGVNVLYENIPHIHTVQLCLYISVGSRYENEKNNGISHFMEHMVVETTENNKKLIDTIQDEIGEITAYTTKDATIYYVRTLKEYLTHCIDVFKKMMENTQFNPDTISKEIKVITEEINISNGSQVEQLNNMLSIATWGSSALSFPIIGTINNISTFDSEILSKFKKDYYISENMIISLAGDFDSSNVDYICKSFSTLNRFKHCYFNDSSCILNKRIDYKKSEQKQVYVAITLNKFQSSLKNILINEIISLYLGKGIDSILFKRLRNDLGYVYSINTSGDYHEDISALQIYSICSKGNLLSVIETLSNEIKNFINSNDFYKNISTLKKRLKNSYIFSSEYISSKSVDNCINEIYFQKPFSLERKLELIDNISIADISQFIDSTLRRKNMPLVLLGDLDQDEVNKIIDKNIW